MQVGEANVRKAAAAKSKPAPLKNHRGAAPIPYPPPTRHPITIRHPPICYIAKNMPKLIETDEWAKLVEGVASGGYVNFSPVFQLRKVEDIADLAALVTGEPGVVRDAALQVLFALCMQNDPHVRPENLRHLCPALKEYVAEGYPEKKLGQTAWTFWRRIDADASAEYLREWVKRKGISESNATRITIDLTFGNDESMAMVRNYAQANPGVTLAAGVQLALERTAVDWQERVAKRGHEWREKHDYATLVYLTTQLIDRVPFVAIPVSKIVEVMGEPDSLVDRCYTFFSKDRGKQTGYLYLETDKQGKLTGWKLDNIS